ncbi:MAG: hypothetical protein AAFX08_03270 [Pseudomonadota bacterium]
MPFWRHSGHFLKLVQSACGSAARDCKGSTAIEYSLIVALIFLVVVVSIRNFADESGRIFDDVSSALIEG